MAESLTDSDPEVNESEMAAMKIKGGNSGFVDDWQSGRDFLETNLMMLDKEAMLDVTFKVGKEEEEVRAHRFILASRSCVFFAMFSGAMAGTDINIPDIEPLTFHELLRYLYTGIISVSAENAVDLLYCSKKYCVKALEQEVLEYCRSSVTASNACTLLEHACLFDEVELQQAALSLMKTRAEQVMQSEDFVRLSKDNLDKVLDMDDMDVQETVVFRAVMMWAKAECARQGKTGTPADIRSIIGDSLFKIRFPLMPQSDFLEQVGPTGILTDSEKVKILERHISPKSPIDPFIATKRMARSKLCKIQRFRQGGIGSPLSRSSDALYLTSDKTVLLQGVAIYAPANIAQGIFNSFFQLLDQATPSNSTATFYITAVVRDSLNKRISLDHEEVKVSSDQETIELNLTHPVTLTSGQRYTLAVLIEGSVKCWGKMTTATRFIDQEEDVTISISHVQTKNCFNSLEEGHIAGFTYTVMRDDQKT